MRASRTVGSVVEERVLAIPEEAQAGQADLGEAQEPVVPEVVAEAAMAADLVAAEPEWEAADQEGVVRVPGQVVEEEPELAQVRAEEAAARVVPAARGKEPENG